jgi:hypothetical protein
MFSHADLRNAKVLLQVPQEILKFFGTFAPPKHFGSGTLGLEELTPTGAFVTALFRMAIISSAAANRSLDSAAREMYNLSALSALSIASLKRSMTERSSPSSSDLIKVSRRINRSRIASMTFAAHF